MTGLFLSPWIYSWFQERNNAWQRATAEQEFVCRAANEELTKAQELIERARHMWLVNTVDDARDLIDNARTHVENAQSNVMRARELGLRPRTATHNGQTFADIERRLQSAWASFFYHVRVLSLPTHGYRGFCWCEARDCMHDVTNVSASMLQIGACASRRDGEPLDKVMLPHNLKHFSYAMGDTRLFGTRWVANTAYMAGLMLFARSRDADAVATMEEAARILHTWLREHGVIDVLQEDRAHVVALMREITERAMWCPNKSLNMLVVAGTDSVHVPSDVPVGGHGLAFVGALASAFKAAPPSPSPSPIESMWLTPNISLELERVGHVLHAELRARANIVLVSCMPLCEPSAPTLDAARTRALLQTLRLSLSGVATQMLQLDEVASNECRLAVACGLLAILARGGVPPSHVAAWVDEVRAWLSTDTRRRAMTLNHELLQFVLHAVTNMVAPPTTDESLSDCMTLFRNANDRAYCTITGAADCHHERDHIDIRVYLSTLAVCRALIKTAMGRDMPENFDYLTTQGIIELYCEDVELREGTTKHVMLVLRDDGFQAALRVWAHNDAAPLSADSADALLLDAREMRAMLVAAPTRATEFPH